MGPNGRNFFWGNPWVPRGNIGLKKICNFFFKESNFIFKFYLKFLGQCRALQLVYDHKTWHFLTIYFISHDHVKGIFRMFFKMFVLFVISHWKPNRQGRRKDLSGEGVLNCAPNFQLHKNFSLKSVKCNVLGAGGGKCSPLCPSLNA